MNAKARHSILIGLIGSGIGKSLTPAMHELEGRRQGMTYIYRIIDIDTLELDVADLPDLLVAAERMGYNGLNITHPCKQAVVPLLDEMSDAAARIGAVNTIVFRDNKRVGHNTDAWGFIKSFDEEIAGSRSVGNILLLGAGGAGTAIAHSLLMRHDCRLRIYDTDGPRAAEVAEILCGVYGNDAAVVVDDLGHAVEGSDGLINATPVGMKIHPGCPIDASLLRRDLWVVDVVYFPLETELVTAATKAGCTVVTGGGMAVYQAERAFEHFTGVQPDAKRMRTHFRSLVEPHQVDVGSSRPATV